MSPDRLEGLRTSLDRLDGKRVVIVGDVMLDMYVAGDVNRISPEAPVPVVRVADQWQRLGGAGNVAHNVRRLGGSPALFSVVGEDAEGERMAELFGELEVPARLVRDASRTTTVKTRVIARNQQVVRIDREDGHALTDAALDALFAELEPDAADVPVLILSDYGKGVICKGFMDRLHARFPDPETRPRIIVDPKTVNYDLYEGVDLITPNAKETFEGSGIDPQDRLSTIKAGLGLFKRLRLRHLLITLGAQGMALFTGPEEVRHIATSARKVFDVTGAGDTVIATFGLAVAAGYELIDAAILANAAAGVAVGQVGTVAVSCEELAEALEHADAPELSHWLGK
jgi:rfaE bifunctional protein kinase chain/domain